MKIKFVTALLFCLPIILFGQNLRWEQMHAPVEESISSLVQLDDNVVFAGSKTHGVYFFNGDSWESRSTGLNENNIIALSGISTEALFSGTVRGIYKYRPADGSWLKIGPEENISSICFNSHGDVFAGGFSKIFRSNDNGLNWSAYPIPQLLSNKHIESLHVTSDGIIFASVPEVASLFVSADNGTSWQISKYGSVVSSLASDSQGRIYAAVDGVGIEVSADNGIQWESLSDEFDGIRWAKIIIDKDDNIFVGDNFGNLYYYEYDDNIVYAVNNGLKPGQLNALLLNSSDQLLVGTEDSGVFLTSDMGMNWTQLNRGFKYGEAHFLFSDMKTNVFTGYFDKGLYKYSPGEQIWKFLSFGGSSNYQFMLNGDNHIFMSFVAGFYASGGLMRSVDDGDTWEEIGQTLPGYPLGTPMINALASDKDGLLYAVLASSDGILKSDDNGSSWFEMPGNIGKDHDIFTLNINRDNYFFAGSHKGTIFRSMDNGANWDSLSTGIQNDIAEIKSANNGGLYARSSFGNELSFSTDQGDTWVAFNLEALGSEITSFDFDDNGRIYVATRGSGVYSSPDNGNNWISINQDLTDLSVIGITISSDNYIYCSTYEKGIFRTNLPVASGIENYSHPSESGIVLINNIYPNPVSNTANISFSLHQPRDISVAIFNPAGLLQMEIPKKYFPEGISELNIDLGKLKNGLYILRLGNKEHQVFKRIIVLH